MFRGFESPSFLHKFSRHDGIKPHCLGDEDVAQDLKRSTRRIRKMKEAKFIEVLAGVRYWEDATLNGERDDEGKIPLRNDDCWAPTIELGTGRVVDWPDGIEADIYYKVCDSGIYWLLDETGARIAKWKGYYVPNSILCVGDDGFGDYIIMNIGPDGNIVDWIPPVINNEDWIPIRMGPSHGVEQE